jgi:hypothetical protein
LEHIKTKPYTIILAILKKYKSVGSDQIIVELLQVEGETLVSVFHKLNNAIWKKEELPDELKKSIIVPVPKKSNKTYCNNYHVISLI